MTISTFNIKFWRIKKMNEIVLKEQNGQIVVSSRDVAEKFGKRHTHVLDSIKAFENDLSTAEFSALFQISSYKASNGKTNVEYLMNRDGFSLLTMGFNGKEALQWKLKYIKAFNQMEEQLKNGDQLTEEERLKLQLFSKDASEVAYAHNRLVELQTASLVARIEKQQPKVEYHDNVLNKDGLINTTTIAKDLGLSSARKLNEILHNNKVIFKDNTGNWQPYANYKWLVSEKYIDYKSYESKDIQPILKWTEKGRKWIIENIEKWSK